MASSYILSSNNTTASYEWTTKTTNTTYKDLCPPLRSLPLNVMAGIIGILVILGNGLVILAVLGGQSRLFRPMYWFIVHISFSDFLIGVMLLWNYCLMAALNLNNTMTSLIVIHSFWLVSACSSVMGITLLALDRYMQVVHREFHRVYFNQITVGVSILLSWIIPISIYMLPPLLMNTTCKESCRCPEDNYMECLPWKECSLVIPPFKKGLVLTAAFYLFTVMLFPIVIYSMIFYKVRKQTKIFHQRMRKRDARLIKTLVAIMAIFFVTLFPTGVVLIIDATTVDNNSELINIGLGAFVVATLNSLANPILYIWRISAIRTSIQRQLPFFKTHSIGARLNSTGIRPEARKVTNSLPKSKKDAMSKTVEEPNAYQPKRKMSWLVLFTRVAFNGTSSQESTPDISVRSTKFIKKETAGQSSKTTEHMSCASTFDDGCISKTNNEQDNPSSSGVEAKVTLGTTTQICKRIMRDKNDEKIFTLTSQPNQQAPKPASNNQTSLLSLKRTDN